MFSLCDSHSRASGGWPVTNVLINGRHTLERLSSCGGLSTVAAAIVIMDRPGSGSQGAGKKVSLITAQAQHSARTLQPHVLCYSCATRLPHFSFERLPEDLESIWKHHSKW